MEFITLEEGVNLLKNPREGHASFPYRRDKSLKRSSTGPSTKKSKSSTSAESSSGENTALNDFRIIIGLSRDGFKMKLLNENAVFINFAGPNVTSNDKAKYNTYPTNFKKKILTSQQDSGPAKLIMAAYSSSTWKTLEAAYNNWANCMKTNNSIIDLDQEKLSKFIWWCYSEKGLKHSTISTYVASLGTIQKIQKQNDIFTNSYTTKTILKGVRNIEAAEMSTKNERLVFTFPLLKILGHCIMKQDWATDSKRIFWAASTMLFFGSFRIGELLSNNEQSYDPLTTLLWEDIQQVGEALRIHVRFPKVFASGGVFVDIFPLKDVTICPVQCLKSLRKSGVKDNDPVFKFGSGKLLTPAQFNKSLKDVLSLVLKPDENKYTSHSFRAAIPSALAENPMLASREELMLWGRWDSSAYMRYTRLKYEQRKQTFYSICSIFNIRPAHYAGTGGSEATPGPSQSRHPR